jgi:hypothetical protein
MNDFLNSIINWAEVWALLIPLAVIFFCRPKAPYLKPVIWYVFLALVLNTVATIIVEYYFQMPAWLKNNNILYNIHSFLRVILFSLFILTVRQYLYPTILKIVLAVYVVFVVVNFSFIDSPFFISSNHFAAESIVLLFFSLSFFLRSMLDESNVNWLKHPSFLVCAGISLYEAICFFIFLFFYPIALKNREFGELTMSIQGIIYVVFCIFLALALYSSCHQETEAEVPSNKR